MALRRTMSRRSRSTSVASATDWQSRALPSSTIAAGAHRSMQQGVASVGGGNARLATGAVASSGGAPSAATMTATIPTPDTTTTALAAPLVPRVLSWFKPGAPFDMEHVANVLHERGVEIDCCYPLLQQQPSSSTFTAATAAAAATAAIKSRNATTGTTTTASSSGGSSSTQQKTRLASSAKDLEVIGFSVRQSSTTFGGKDAASASPLATSATAAKHLEQHHAAAPKTTYFVFAEGSLVGWNCSWDELVWMRGTLQPPQQQTSSSPDAGQPHSASSSTSPTMSRIAAAMPHGLVSLVPSSFRHRIAPHSVSTRSVPNGSNSAAALAAAAAARTPTASAAAPSIAIESMRYQLFMTLPMSERPQDSEQDPQSYIDVHHDRIILQDDGVSTKLPFSFALVQSVQLEALNTALEPVTLVVKRWQQQLSIDGRLVCTLKSLRKAKTQLLSIVESLNFRHHTHTTPRIFWSGDFHALRGHYRDACEHLEIEDRASSLKAQLESIDESLSYLHDEAHASHNEWLTWVIIILITMEVAVALGVLDRVVPLMDRQLTWIKQAAAAQLLGGKKKDDDDEASHPTS